MAFSETNNTNFLEGEGPTLRLLIGLIENSSTFWKHFWNIWKIILLLTEDDGPKSFLTNYVPRAISSISQLLIKTKNVLCTKLEKSPSYKRQRAYWMWPIGGNDLATNFGRWILGDQISSPNATNVIATVGTKFKFCQKLYLRCSTGLWVGLWGWTRVTIM